MKYITALGVLLCLIGLIIADTSSCYGDVCTIRTSNERIIGTIISLLGIAWFTLLNIKNSRILALLTISGGIGISYLVYYTIINEHYCPICITAYFVGILAIISAFKRLNISQNIYKKRRLKCQQ